MTTMRIRRPRLRLLLELSPRLIFAFPIGLGPWLNGQPIDHFAGAMVLLILVLVPLPLLAGSAIDLTPTHLIQRSLVRPNAVPWSAIQGFNHQRGRVDVLTDDGAVHRLIAPSSAVWLGTGQRFTDDYLRLGQWWLDHRGPDWQPLPLNPWADSAAPRTPLPDPWILLSRPWSRHRPELP